MTRTEKVSYKRIWSSFNGCNCPPESRQGERCTAKWVRCDGRTKVIAERLESELGLNLAGLPITKESVSL